MIECKGKPIVYMVTYWPNFDNQTPPYFYIGSSLKWRSDYFGSVASKKPMWFTKGRSLKDWWRDALKLTPNDFHIEVLWVGDEDTTKHILLEEERFFQESHQVVESDCYFNNAYANERFHSRKRQERTHNKISKSLKEFYKTSDGLAKSARLSERNRMSKSKEMVERFKNQANRDKVSLQMQRQFQDDEFRQKWSVDRIGPRKYKVSYKGVEYSLRELAEIQGVGEGTILHRARNKSKNFDDWKLICLK